MSQEICPPSSPSAVPCVLLVDDHPANLLALEVVLEPLGLHLMRASSGRDALRQLLSNEFAVIVLDVNMPDMDGFETAALVRRLERTREIPIIFISAFHRDDAYQAKGYAHGAVDYLPKPFNPDILRAKVAAFAELWRRAENLRVREAMLFERERAELVAREKRAQAEAANSAAVLDAVVAGAPIGIAIFDVHLRCERINAALAEMHGVPAEGQVGRTLAETLPEGSETTATIERLERVFTTGEPLLNLEVARPVPGGSGHQYSLTSYFPVRVEGRVGRVAMTVVDVTALRAAEARAATRRQNLHRLMSVAAALSEAHTSQQVAEIAVAQGRAILGAKRAVLGVLTEDGAELAILQSVGFEEAELSPWPYVPLTHPLPMTDAVREQRPLFFETAAAAADRYPPIASSRSPGHEALAAVPLLFEERGLGVLVLSFDERRSFSEADRALLTTLARLCAQAMERARLYDAEARARAEAETANRAKDEFLALLSHELRSPLNASLGWTTMLRDNILPAEKRERALATVERNIRAQVALIEDLLDVSRIVAGKLQLNSVQSLELAGIVESAIDAVRPAAEAKSISVEGLVETQDRVHGDPGRLLQIVTNLLGNAIKFTPKGGSVRLHLRRVDGSIELSVTDNGQGISPAFLPHVFDKFRQADSGMTRTHGGLGLGLAIVKHLVELHGGTITAHSEGSGKGAVFVMRVPIAEVTARPTTRPR
ncbi:ATP-binding protein [Polyangium sp. 15x6]|uniref:hybrid sensor histidine kinase/response regulator n=1 Tax=Polyangium sp. 15x6 TaxID=3042687 RepID=UPI00249CF457|nr:ATP-binding protein [Polyangium sp. 15x6]MDI3285383.1 ATP-binding protein [Polyangium sp. 15x6]